MLELAGGAEINGAKVGAGGREATPNKNTIKKSPSPTAGCQAKIRVTEITEKGSQERNTTGKGRQGPPGKACPD